MAASDDTFVWGGKTWAAVGDAKDTKGGRKGKGKGGKGKGKDAGNAGTGRDSSADRRKRDDLSLVLRPKPSAKPMPR